MGGIYSLEVKRKGKSRGHVHESNDTLDPVLEAVAFSYSIITQNTHVDKSTVFQNSIHESTSRSSTTAPYSLPTCGAPPPSLSPCPS